MNEPALSIIVPIYNTEKYLRECVESIRMQAYDSCEVILVDDGSTDSSPSLCDKYAEDNDNVKVVHKANGGIISARKAGLAVAEGEYIGFVDSDDWIEKDMYRCMMKNAVENNADLVSCGYYSYSANSRLTVRETKEKENIVHLSEDNTFLSGIMTRGFDWRSNRSITPSVCNKLFRKSLLSRAYEHIDESIVWDEDTITVISVILDSECIVKIPDILYHYRANTSSVSHKINRSVLKNYVTFFADIDKINKEHEGILNDQIPFFSLTAARTILGVGFGVTSGKQYLFPFDLISTGSRVIIYGAGQVGRCYYSELSRLDYAKEFYLTDTNPNNWGGNVISPADAFSKDYDLVLLAVENEGTAEKIKMDLIEKGVPEEKIIWKEPIVLKDVYSFCLDR